MNQVPVTNFPNSLRFYGFLTCGLLWNKAYPIHDPFLPGTNVSIQYDDSLVRGTINNIPLPVSTIIKYSATPLSNQSDDSSQLSELTESPQYAILRDSGITVEKSYDDLIKYGWDDDSPSSSKNNVCALEVIPHILRHDSKVTMDHTQYMIPSYQVPVYQFNMEVIKFVSYAQIGRASCRERV